MARVTELTNVDLNVTALEDGGIRLILTDLDAKETLWVAVPPHVVEQMLRKMTGGIQIARTVPKL